MPKSGLATKRLEQLAPTLAHTRADLSRNGNGRNKKLPHVTLGAFGGF